MESDRFVVGDRVFVTKLAVIMLLSVILAGLLFVQFSSLNIGDVVARGFQVMVQ